MIAKRDEPNRQVLGLLGVGLDNKDGHQRITRSEEFLLLGGSQQTHEQMQDMAMRFSDSLRQRGKRLSDASVKEVLELLHKATDR